MRERLVADWLTKAGERGGLDVAFCQVLLSQRHKILRAGHGPTEAGKDIITEAPGGKLCAYQIKQGDIDLKIFRDIQPQITNLVEAAISHPNVRRGASHSSFLVTTGKFSTPVESLVSELNDAWRRRKYKPLRLIGADYLHPQFIELAADFWPVEPPEIRSFLTLYLAEGNGDFDHAAFCDFVHKLLPGGRTAKTIAVRRIAAANLFASYLLEPFHRQNDHWSAFQGWTMVAAHQLWMAEVHHLSQKESRASFELARTAAMNALTRLSAETLVERALSPRGSELDEYTRLRNTVSASAVAAWHLIQLRNGEQPTSLDQATALIDRLAHNGRLWFWGESALPSLTTIVWFLERTGKLKEAEHLLVHLLSAVANRNGKHGDNPFAPPDVLPDDVLVSILTKMKEHKPQRGRRAIFSWSLDSLTHLVARRLRRQTLSAFWSQITEVNMAGFKPKRPADLLLWHCDSGEEFTRKAGKPQSWKDLVTASRAAETSELPSCLCNDPDFALMFALAYPHRSNRALIKSLDTWFE